MAALVFEVPNKGLCKAYPYGLDKMPCPFLFERRNADLLKTGRCRAFQVNLKENEKGRWLKCKECSDSVVSFPKSKISFTAKDSLAS